MSDPEQPSLAFADVVIDFAGHRLLRAGAPQPLEPKAFAVLALLASAPGQAFSRDEILDAVWGHRHVTPGVLNRVMTLLRHALGEDAHTARYLHTLHGVGYRFDLPAVAVAAQAETATPEPPAGAPQSALAPMPDGVPHRRAGDSEPRPADTKTAPARRATAIIVLVVLALGAAAYWWWQRPRPHVASPTPIAAPARPAATLIVMPLQTIGSGIADRELAAGLSEELIGTLAHIGGLRVIARESTALATAQPTDLQQLTRRLHVSHVLEGSVRSSGKQLRVSLRLVEAASGQTRWAQDYDRGLGDFLVVERDVAQSVSTALSLQLGPRPAPATPMDPELYRRYLLARGLLRGGVLGADKAIAAFRALSAEAPDDARVHEGLADALYFRGFGSYAVVALRDEAIIEAHRALALDPTLADPYGILAEPACRAAQWDDCLGLLRRAVDGAPTESFWRSIYAWRLATLGYLSQAREQLDLALAADPLAQQPNYMMSVTLDALGQHDAARPYARSGTRNPANATIWFNAIWRRDYAEASRLAEHYGDQRWRPTYILVTAALQDPAGWPAARAEIAASEQSVPDGWRNWARILLPEPDVAGDLQILEQIWKKGFSGMSNYLWAPELANHRRDPAFQDYLRRNHMPAYWRVHGWPDRCRPGDHDDAICD